MNNKTLKNWAFKKVNESLKKAVERVKNDGDFKEFYSNKEKLLDAWFIKKEFSKRQIKEFSEKDYKFIVDAYNNKVIENYKKTAEATKRKIEKICIANIPAFISVVVEWYKSATWGANPQAKVITGENYNVSRKVGGCGYDKESTATAECFNNDLGILKIALVSLYKKEHSKKYLGSGYGATIDLFGVSFSGGVGFNCHESIITNSGFYRVTARTGGKMFNTYYFERKGAKNV